VEVTVTNMGSENRVIHICFEGDPGIESARFHATSTTIEVEPESEGLHQFGILFAGAREIRSPTSIWVGPHDERTANLKNSQSSFGPGHGGLAWSYGGLVLPAGLSTVLKFYVGEIGEQSNSSV
jgi:hypothetical protein